jgi:hypothetical protein
MSNDRQTKRFRCAVEPRAEETAQAKATETGEPWTVFRVSGGYEARAESLGEPIGSNIKGKTFEPKAKPSKRAPVDVDLDITLPTKSSAAPAAPVKKSPTKGVRP